MGCPARRAAPRASTRTRRVRRAWPRPRQRARPRRGDRSFLDAGFHVAQLLLHFRAIDRLTVAGERLLPRGGGVGKALLFESQVAEMILDRGAGRQSLRGLAERRVGEIELALAEVRPAETVE